jgi:hypothetical protein
MSEISRRNFLKVLGGLSLSPLAHLPPGESPREWPTDDRKVYLRVVRIASYFYTRDGYKLGCVPQIDNPIPAAPADQEVAVGAEVYQIISRDEDYPWLNMRLYMLIPKE